MKAEYIVCLIFMLTGAVLVIISMVLRHKGMWNLRNDDIPNSRSFREPYDVTVAGAGLFFVGVLCGIWKMFGAWTAALIFVVVMTANLVFNSFMLRRVDTDEASRYQANIIISAFAVVIGGLMLVLT